MELMVVFVPSNSLSLFNMFLFLIGFVPASCPPFFPPEFQQKRMSIQFRQTLAKDLATILSHKNTLSNSPPTLLYPPLAPFFSTSTSTNLLFKATLQHIISFLPLTELGRISSTCRSFTNIVPAATWQHQYNILKPKKSFDQTEMLKFVPKNPSISWKELLKIAVAEPSYDFSAVVLECGTYTLKAGLAGDDLPAVSMRSCSNGKLFLLL
jgi:hypothetical protein